jgi:secondary thiamine-phosphate synthase enzyme
MKILSKTISVKTRGDCDIIDITSDVAKEVSASGIGSGTVTVFITGSTAGVTTIEYEPGLIEDLKRAFDKIIPSSVPYEHNKRWGDGNGHAHVRASMLGASFVVPFSDKELALGTWQQIVVVDFDNRPRTRNIRLQIMGE